MEHIWVLIEKFNSGELKAYEFRTALTDEIMDMSTQDVGRIAIYLYAAKTIKEG